MSRKIDLTGQRFGRLVVVEETEARNKSGSIFWKCQCDCGNQTTATTAQLNNNSKKSCGCLRSDVGKRTIYQTSSHSAENDITGERYGKLKVIEQAEKTLNGNRYWKCECDCGVVKDILGLTLKNGSTISCGCYASEIHKKSIKKAHKWADENDFKEGTKLSGLNDTIPSTNTSGHKGVSWSKSRNRWVAQLKIKGRNINLGRYKNIQDAINARKEAEEKYFKPILEKYGKEV